MKQKKPVLEKQTQSVKELQALFETKEYKQFIDKEGYVKHCTAGTEENSLIKGCRMKRPLYEFPLVVQYKNNVHAYAPDADGVIRRNICKTCQREYNKLTAQKRRAKIFTKEEALLDLEKYCRERVKTNPLTDPVCTIVRNEQKQIYTFNDIIKLRREAKILASEK